MGLMFRIYLYSRCYPVSLEEDLQMVAFLDLIWILLITSKELGLVKTNIPMIQNLTDRD